MAEIQPTKQGQVDGVYGQSLLLPTAPIFHPSSGVMDGRVKGPMIPHELSHIFFPFIFFLSLT
jgi:hypothetical protein